MSTIQTTDIAFLLSGGSSNSNPSMSLGGNPSSTPVSGNMNSLFSDVPASSATEGLVDYRCFYILNKSETETLYSASLHIHIQSLGGSSADVGVAKSTEVQTIQISGSPSSGTATFRLGDDEFSGSWGGSLASFVSSLSSSLSSAGLGDVQISYASGSNQQITLNFLGSLDNKSYPLVELVENGLSGSPAISITRNAQGSPINSVAPVIATAATSPAGVVFQQTSPSSKISVGTLGPGDSMPVWVRRTTPAGTSFKEGDSLTIRLSGDPFGDQ